MCVVVVVVRIEETWFRGAGVSCPKEKVCTLGREGGRGGRGGHAL